MNNQTLSSVTAQGSRIANLLEESHSSFEDVCGIIWKRWVTVSMIYRTPPPFYRTYLLVVFLWWVPSDIDRSHSSYSIVQCNRWEWIHQDGRSKRDQRSSVSTVIRTHHWFEICYLRLVPRVSHYHVAPTRSCNNNFQSFFSISLLTLMLFNCSVQ